MWVHALWICNWFQYLSYCGCNWFEYFVAFFCGCCPYSSCLLCFNLLYPWLNLAILTYKFLSYLGDPDWVGASEHQPGNPRGNCGMLFFCCLLTFHLYYPTIIWRRQFMDFRTQLFWWGPRRRDWTSRWHFLIHLALVATTRPSFLFLTLDYGKSSMRDSRVLKM